MKQSLITLLRTIILGITMLWIALSLWPEKEDNEGSLPCIYSSECEDRLFHLFIKAISQAKREIDLTVYALSDPKTIMALNQASKRGVQVKVMYDKKTETEQLHALSSHIEKIPFTSYALMHRKILIIDCEKVYIGSSNFTPHSLRLHHNLVIGIHAKKLAKRILDKHCPPFSLEIGGQFVECYLFPEEKGIGLQRIFDMIENAQHTLTVGMFTWSYTPLTEAVIKAHQRGVKVTIILDQQSAYGASNRTMEALLQAGIPVRLGPGYKLFHHKFLYVDNKTLVTGSSNWTKAAFSRNHECLIILHKLTEKQQKKMDRMNKIIRCSTFFTPPYLNKKMKRIFTE